MNQHNKQLSATKEEIVVNLCKEDTNKIAPPNNYLQDYAGGSDEYIRADIVYKAMDKWAELLTSSSKVVTTEGVLPDECASTSMEVCNLPVGSCKLCAGTVQDLSKQMGETEAIMPDRQILTMAGAYAEDYEENNPSAEPKTCSFNGFYEGAIWMAKKINKSHDI